jgi:hypothetical protein
MRRVKWPSSQKQMAGKVPTILLGRAIGYRGGARRRSSIMVFEYDLASPAHDVSSRLHGAAPDGR